MLPIGLSYYERHFLFSNRLFQFFLGLNSRDQFFMLCAIIGYLLPLIVHQFYQLYTTDKQLQSAIKILESLIPGLHIIYCYITVYFSLTTIKLLLAHIKFDYEFVRNEMELNIMEKYTNKSKLYVYVLVVLLYLYIISITFPSILSVFLYIFGTSGSIHLTLPFPIDNVLQAGSLYYSLLIYQIIAIFILITISIILYSLYWVLIQHACGQLCVIILNIRKSFNNDQKYVENDWCIATLQDERNWMVHLIQFYTRITKFVDLLNNLSKMVYLIAILIAMLLVFFNFLYIFQLSTILKNKRQTIECCIYLIAFVFIIYINFYIGQLLIHHSDDVFKELCNIPFYNFSVQTQKLLLLLLIRSIKPTELSIGGMFVVSHEVFAGIVQKAYSFAAIYYNTIKTSTTLP